MQIRRATAADLQTVLKIYSQARAYMKANGNPNQWGDTYPPHSLVQQDLAQNHLYVCEEANEILGVFCYFEGIDPTYERIYEGEWLNKLPYGVLHRIATVAHGKGVAATCFAYCFHRCGNLKIDTHRDNLPMQRALSKNGFSRCGIIYLESGDERIAYQKSTAAQPNGENADTSKKSLPSQ